MMRAEARQGGWSVYFCSHIKKKSIQLIIKPAQTSKKDDLKEMTVKVHHVHQSLS